MKQSQLFIPTMKENPADADCASHRYLYRAGFIRQNAAGIYSYLPLGHKVLQKIQAIIREEMNRTGAQELLMPAIQPAELWHETGRWDVYGPELMRLKDRHGRDFALGATHEELITSLTRDFLNSYKKLPMTLYQIQAKYRDERRPRFGLLRGREFLMKDAYSFHSDEVTLDQSYETMFQAYKNIFNRCGLDFRAVIADSGAMGGKDTHEFMALADVGEDTIAFSSGSEYAANIEMASVMDTVSPTNEPVQVLDTGDYDRSDEKEIHVSFFTTGSTYVAVYSRGQDEVNDVKVKNLLEADVLDDVDASELTFDVLNPGDVEVLADQGLKAVVNGFIAGTNGEVQHYNVNPERDLGIESFSDVRMIQEGDPSPDGHGTIQFAQGIEIGQVFKLGTKYSEAMGAEFLDENGKSKPLKMGCYGIGVSRTLSAVAEQYHDDDGLKWPVSIAPFHVHVIAVNPKKMEQMELAESIYKDLDKQGHEVLLDDRKERAGVKFADADLIGCPVRVTVGKRAAEGIVEVKIRATGESFESQASEVIHTIAQYLN
ncbi:proline--tRNA ligase [Tuberibacillus sp. Marseille-P3662]|uniref:proline--tRNA ligase n=1 Tax=Tuberibacillus sp. Marseille-P3662 TaxID=1965358 RepID=UPI000A1CE231|nr:proline--tRNA ligase [Tuberibacillus sp. Marseille-P3662]